MKHKLLLFCFERVVFWAFIIWENVFSQTPGIWETRGPTVSYIPRINVLISDPQNPLNIYAGTDGSGVLRSIDAGLTWTFPNAPIADKDVAALIFVGDTLIAGTRGNGVFWSPDGGITWFQANTSINNKEVTTLLFVDDTLYAGTRGDGIFRSADRGINWSQFDAPMNDENVIALISVSGKLIVGTYDNGIFYSENSDSGGITWKQAEDSMNAKNLTTLLAIGNTLYAGASNGLFWSKGGIKWSKLLSKGAIRTMISSGDTLYVGLGIVGPECSIPGGIFYSCDKGVSWTQAEKLMDGRDVTSLILVNAVLYAGTEENCSVPGGVYYSDSKGKDRGKNWKRAKIPMDDQSITTLLSIDERLYAGTLKAGVLRSIDGRSWFGSNNQFNKKVNAELDGLIVGLDFIITYGQDGLFCSMDGGFQWTQVKFSVNDYQKVTTAIRINDTLYAATSGSQGLGLYFGYIFYSTDNCKTWLPSYSLYGNYITTIISVEESLYAGFMESGGPFSMPKGLISSRNGGKTWDNVDGSPINVTTLLSVNDTIFAGTVGFRDTPNHITRDPYGIFYSTNKDGSWTHANKPMNDKNVTTMLSANGRIYAGTGISDSASGIFYSNSKDDDINWTQANAPMNNKIVTTMLFVGDTLYAGTGGNEVPNIRPSGIFYSTGKGKTWTQANAPMNDKWITTIFAVNGILYAGTKDDGVYKSTDRGVNWFPLQVGMGKITVTQLAYLARLNRLYAATNNGVYFQTLDYTPPTAISMKINGGAAFSGTREVLLSLNAVEADSVIFSEDSIFNNKNWQPYQKNLSFILSSGDGLKTIYAKFKDISWNESQVISSQIILDTTPPKFLPHTPPTTVRLGETVPIKQQVLEANLQSMKLYFRRGGEPWSENQKYLFKADFAEIDGAFITIRGIDYGIVAADLVEHKATLQNGSLDFFSIPVVLGVNDAGSSPGLPSGTGGSAYRIVSVPMELNGAPSVKSVFGDLGSYGVDEDWRFWTYRGSNQWSEGDNVKLQNGEGYFLILRNGGTLTNKVSGTTMKTTAGVLGAIPGWHLRANDWTIIGNPYNTRIELSQLKLKNRNKLLSEQDTNFQVWAYDGSWKRENLILEPWGGLAVYSTTADTIVFANASDPYAKGLPKSSSPFTEHLQENEWLLQIRAESQDYADNENYFGVRKGASAEQDVYDWYEPPIIPGAISVSFPHSDWQNPVSFAADIRPINNEGYKWEIKLKGERGAVMNLSFAQIETIPKSFEILLLDESSHLLRDLRQQPQVEIRIPQEAETKNLVILVGKQDFVQSHTTGLRAIPQSFALHQNYPNPFNPTTVIRYELPVSGKVTLKIYNLLGTEVTTLENDEPREPGYYEKVVDLRNFASGIYFYRISVSGEKRFEATKKMVLAK